MGVFSVTLKVNGDESNKMANDSILIVILIVLERAGTPESVAVTGNT